VNRVVTVVRLAAEVEASRPGCIPCTAVSNESETASISIP